MFHFMLNIFKFPAYRITCSFFLSEFKQGNLFNILNSKFRLIYKVVRNYYFYFIRFNSIVVHFKQSYPIIQLSKMLAINVLLIQKLFVWCTLVNDFLMLYYQKLHLHNIGLEINKTRIALKF